jgi:hypothetical protein
MISRRALQLGLATFCALLLGCSATAQTKTDLTLRERLTGAWRLVSIETIRPSGEIIYPFYGKHPQGLIVYDRSGWMSVQIVSDPAPTVPTADSREGFAAAPVAEKAQAAEGYYAYAGTWTLDAANRTVTHHIKQSLVPGERGEDFLRHLSVEGDRLTLNAKIHEMGEDHQRKLVWQRIPPEQP